MGEIAITGWYQKELNFLLLKRALLSAPGREVAAFLAAFTVCVLLYHANPDTLVQIDTVPPPYVAWSLIHSQDFDVTEFGHLLRHCSRVSPAEFIKAGRGGRLIFKGPPGAAIMAVPFYCILPRFEHRLPENVPSMVGFGRTVGAIYCALATAVFFLIARRLLSPGAALLSTILFGFGTTVYSTAAQSLWQHGPAVLWVCVALLVLTWARPGGSYRIGFVAGMAIGMGVLCRPTLVVFLAGLAAWLGVRREWRTSIGLCLGGGVLIGLLVVYNVYYTGTLVAGGYGEEAGMWTTPLWLGLAGLLAAPSRGLLFFTPTAVLAVPGVAKLISRRTVLSKTHRDVLLGGVLGAGLTLALHAKWGCWFGGWCYGPRFLTEVMPVVCLLFGLGYQHLASWHARALAVALVCLSVGVHIAGVFGSGRDWAWHSQHYIPPQATDLFSFRDNQIAWAMHNLAGKLGELFSR